MQKAAFCSGRFMSGWLPSKKLLMVMKMISFLLLVCCLHVSATTASQTVTLQGKNMPLQKVFAAIEAQAGYSVSGNMALLKAVKPVTVAVRNMPVDELLNLVLENQQIGFHIDGKDIVLYRKQAQADMSAAVLQAPPPPVLIKGAVVDAAGKVLAGAAIRVKGRNASAVSDEQGSFTIEANIGEVLVVSYIGYTSTEHTLTGTRNIVIALAQQVTAIEEVAVSVNTGYQSIPRERATGSYAILGTGKIENKLRPDLRAALEGQVAGLVLSKDGSIEMRGVSTFNSGDRSPLIIVDGYPITGGLESINIDAVQSVTVLKDAVAASIYGTRSSNGVIVVTTKQGRKGELNIGYRATGGMVLKPDLNYLARASAADYVDAEMELYEQDANSYLTRYNAYGYLSRVNYLMLARSQGWMPEADVDAEIAKLKSNDGLGQLEKHLFRNQLSQQHNISISGGSDKSQVAASAKFISNRGNTLYTHDNRVIFDIRNDWKPVKGVTVRLLSNINYTTSAEPARSVTSMLEYYSNLLLHPYDLVVDPATGQHQDIFATNPLKISRYGAIAGLKPMQYNPLNDLGQEMTRNQNLQLRLGGSINVQIVNGLNVEAGGTWIRGNGFSRSVYSQQSYQMRMAFNDATSATNPSKHYIPDGDMIQESRSVNQAYTLRTQVNFNRTYGKHSIIAIAGAELSRYVNDDNTYPTRFGYNNQAGTFATFNYADYNAGLYNADMLRMHPLAPVNIGSYRYRDDRFTSWYANASYEFDRRFLVSGSMRLDLTNFFGTNPDYRYKPLWSAGGTYKLSNEKFFHINWMNKLYLRGSYGLNGNISLNAGPFLIVTPGTFNSLTGDIAYSITSPPNNSLRWEKTLTTNLGADMAFANSRVNLSVDYYLRKSKDLLSPDFIDPTIGYTSLQRNVGRINNKGLEVLLEGDVLRRKDFTWKLSGTMAYNNNTVQEYNVNYQYGSSFMTSVNRKGYAANALFSYRNAGLDENGNPVYWNSKGQKVDGGDILADDVAYSGTLRPKFTYGLTNTFRYKNVDIAFMVIAKTGNVMRKWAYDGGNISHEDVAKRWRKPGDENNTIYPMLSAFSMNSFYFPMSDVFAEDAAFLKLRDASVTYHFNRNWLKQAGIKEASVIVQGRNLLMLTRNSGKRDPEGVELENPGSQQAELGFTPFRPMPEFYLGLRVDF